ncbi:putative RNA-binding protein EEED8.10 [Cephus cinctus]|uniref:RNA-binding protein EEED8.10 n=1 Tax=Cephus cinctus TaxID=211228 RepID=A0AAJ7FKI8_CEPCN|nr:putative RNA-binding protein EEED8.10 [Cephus cinctus]XP_015596387.1 putative RNA-binding protein EEED8.10 [Cephus cinctus]
MEDIEQHLSDFLSRIRVYSDDALLDLSSEESSLSTTEDGVPIRKLFVGNLAQRTTHKELDNLFSKFGKVDSCYLKRNAGKSNYAFITFSNVEDALKARKEGLRKEIRLHSRDLRVMPADSWHQPDSVENQRKLAAIKKKTDKNSDIEEQLFQDYTADDNALINRLNDDCLIHVFLYLPIADRVKIERVCKRWRAVSQESWRAVKRLDLSQSAWGLCPKKKQRSVDTPILRKVLLRCGRFLNHIDFSEMPHQLRQSTLTIVGKFCPNLETIDVTALNVSASGIDSLTNSCENITELSLGSCTSYCDNDLQKLFAVNRKLRYFRIRQNNHMTGKCLLHLPSDTIEEISLEQCNAMLPCHFSNAIEKFEKLTHLSLVACIGINDNVMQAISIRANSLKSLQLSNYFPIMSKCSMLEVAKLINLEVLNVAENPAVTDEFLNVVAARCLQLKMIDITGCNTVTNKGMSRIATLPKLEHLVMSYLGEVNDEPFVGMQNLCTLECKGCPLIGDTGISTLIQISQNLEQLDLSGCDLITNRTLEVAQKATRIRTNSKILKIVVGGTRVIVSELKEVSPFLQIVNVDLSLMHMRPDFDHDVFFPSEDEDEDENYEWEFDQSSISSDDNSYEFVRKEFHPPFL